MGLLNTPVICLQIIVSFQSQNIKDAINLSAQSEQPILLRAIDACCKIVSVMPDPTQTTDPENTAPDLKHNSGRRRVAAWVVAAAVAIGVVTFTVTKIMRPDDVATALNTGYYATARALLQVQADSGDPEAQNMLGNLHYLGLGGAQDYRLATQWYLKSALQNNSNAQVNIARHYQLGLGVAKDPQRGIGWLQLARSNGNETAEGHMKLHLSRLELTPNQIQQARQQYRTLESLRPTEETQ